MVGTARDCSKEGETSREGEEWVGEGEMSIGNQGFLVFFEDFGEFLENLKAGVKSDWLERYFGRTRQHIRVKTIFRVIARGFFNKNIKINV